MASEDDDASASADEDSQTAEKPEDGAVTETLLASSLVEGEASTALGETQHDDGAEEDPVDLSKLPVAYITMEHEEVDQPSARTKGLLAEAELRAQQQEFARVTMLDLARALEEAVMRKREVERMLEEEKGKTAELYAKNSDLEDKLTKATEKVDKTKMRRYQDVAPLHDGLFKASTWLAQLAFPLGVMAPNAPTVGPRPEPTMGDFFAVREWLRAWKKITAEARNDRLKDSRLADLQKKWEEERKKMMEDAAKALQAEKNMSLAMEQKYNKAMEEMRRLEFKLQKAEEEIESARKEAEAARIAHLAETRRLEEQLRDARQEVEAKDKHIAEVERLLEEEKAGRRLDNERNEAEKQNLKAEIRRIHGELQESIIQLRRMRELVLRAKKEATGSVSAEKYAQLIADLEEMRDRLGILGRESEYERENAAWLRAKLNQNQRSLELERQFLPLLHKVRGPVGPKNTALKTKSADNWAGAGAGAPPAPLTEKRLSQSMSAGMLDNTRLAGGRQSGGMPLGGRS